MTPPIVVTTGKRFCDLDALACVIAYQQTDPEKYVAVITGELNHSIIPAIRHWNLNYQTSSPNEVSGYIVMDVSEDNFIADFVETDKIIALFDHHFGFENIWAKRPWVKTKIEEIGACATLVWEEIKNQYQNSPLPPLSANLLYTAIVTHTLNFKISITKDRDRQAAEEVKKYTNLPESWISQYYREIESDVYKNPQQAVINDTKIANLNGQTLAIGQIEMWLPENFIKVNANTIRSALKEFGTELWLFTAPGISKGINYLFTENQSVKEWLRMQVGATFPDNGDLGYTRRLWLRKEILRELLNKA